MIICGLDFETTGLKAGPDRATELAAVFVEVPGYTIVETLEPLIWDETYPPLSEIIVKLTGITDEKLRTQGIAPRLVFQQLIERVIKNDVQCIVAHNAQFDRSFFKAESKRLEGVIPQELIEKALEIPWVCSMKDISHPVSFKSKKLMHLALDYGVAIDPALLHRAIADVTVMLKMLEKANADFTRMVGNAATPDVIIKAIIPPPFGPGNDGGKGKDAAKANYFSWQKCMGSEKEYKNTWVKRVKENEIQKEREKLGYNVAILEKCP